MFRVGLTGGIGSGKSTVANLFKQQGITVIDTDEIAHQISAPDGPAYPAIIETFGIDILNHNDSIDRQKLASIIFSDDKKKQQLEAILHPLIWIIVEQQVQTANSPYCIIVVPLLAEGQHQARFNSILAIDSDEETQINRVIERDNRSKEQVQAILAKQATKLQRQQIANEVIVNNGDLHKLETEVKKLHQRYLNQAKA